MKNSFQDKSSLVGRILMIKLRKDKAFLLPNKVLGTDYLSYNSHLKNFQKDAFWRVHVLNITSDNARIHVKVIEYGLGERPFPEEQYEYEQVLLKIEYITFSSIDTEGLLKTTCRKPVSRSSQKSDSEDFSDNEPYRNHEISGIVLHESESAVPLQFQFLQTFSKKVNVKIRDILFIDGGVKFLYWDEDNMKPIEIIVSNPNIKEEFNAIKPYIIKALKIKCFEVDLDLQKENGIVTCVKATSNEIDKINEDIIEAIKYDLVKTGLRKMSKKGVEVFDIDQLRKLGISTKKEMDFPIKTDEIFEKVLQISKAKHFKSLKYLSKMHKSSLMKLRYFLKPFSCLFLIEAKDFYVFVWETLTTEEATYIWKTEKSKESAKLTLDQIILDIKQMRETGKLSFLSESEHNHPRIFHDYSDPDLGYSKWIKDLEKHIQA